MKDVKKELATRILARKNFYFFLKLKWQRYNKAAFLDNWHFQYLAKLLTHTLHTKASDDKLIKRLMLNMPPSYGKTETIARTFIAWALGNDRSRKFIYISYSDELCKKISNQVRDLIKSSFWQSIFKQKAEFLQDNSSEFIFKEGGGLFVTTLKSAITGFHAHSILIDDPIKVSEMSSKSARNLVNQNFKESVLSRLQDTNSNITILMQRLGYEDLCGFLLDERNFDKETIAKWQVIKLEALNDKELIYEIEDFSYTRKANEPLFPLKHDLKQLQELKKQMGDDEFSTQYQQEPQASEAGFFEASYFKEIASFDINEHNEYIFVDNALSVEKNADNRAIVILGVDRVDNNERYIVKDCLYGIWDEEKTCLNVIESLLSYPKAKLFIENDGGGILLYRLLLKEIVRINEKLKKQGKSIITNEIKTYNANRKISKVEKIKAIKPYYNSGFLVFLNKARNLNQIKKELLSFNPAKPFRKDDCIDCIASAIAMSEVSAPYKSEEKPKDKQRLSTANSKIYTSSWRV